MGLGWLTGDMVRLGYALWYAAARLHADREVVLAAVAQTIVFTLSQVPPGGLFDLIQRDAASSPTFVRAVVGKRISRIGSKRAIRDSNSLPFCRRGIPPRRLVWPPYTLDRSLDRSYSGVSRFSAAGA